jgi:hypothetical protein
MNFSSPNPKKNKIKNKIPSSFHPCISSPMYPHNMQIFSYINY